MTSLENIQAGFNSCFIVRYLLEKADNTENALFLLMKLPIASNCNIPILFYEQLPFGKILFKTQKNSHKKGGCQTTCCCLAIIMKKLFKKFAVMSLFKCFALLYLMVLV